MRDFSSASRIVAGMWRVLVGLLKRNSERWRVISAGLRGAGVFRSATCNTRYCYARSTPTQLGNDYLP